MLGTSENSLFIWHFNVYIIVRREIHQGNGLFSCRLDFFSFGEGRSVKVTQFSVAPYIIPYYIHVRFSVNHVQPSLYRLSFSK